MATLDISSSLKNLNIAKKIPSIFGSKKQSITTILCKKIDIVTSPHIDDPHWDIVLDIIDNLKTNKEYVSKKVLNHLRNILEKSFQKSGDNQSLYNCLTVIDSLVRNCDAKVINIIHNTYLNTMEKLARQSNLDAKKQSLIQSQKKSLQERVLGLIWSWAKDIDQLLYPNFRSLYVKLRQDGIPFDKVEQMLVKKPPVRIKPKSYNEQKQSISYNNNNNNNYNKKLKSSKPESPWELKYTSFGKWYKAKLKNDLKTLCDTVVMTQDVIASKDIETSIVLCNELREANKRLATLILRTKDPSAVDSLMTLASILANLIENGKKLRKKQRIHIPGISRDFLLLLVKDL